MTRRATQPYRDGYLQIIEDLMDGPKTATVLAASSRMTLNTVGDFLARLEARHMAHPVSTRAEGSNRRVTVWHWCPIPGEIPDTAKP